MGFKMEIKFKREGKKWRSENITATKNNFFSINNMPFAFTNITQKAYCIFDEIDDGVNLITIRSNDVIKHDDHYMYNKDSIITCIAKSMERKTYLFINSSGQVIITLECV